MEDLFFDFSDKTKDKSEIKQIILTIKKQCDNEGIKTGICVQPKEQITRICQKVDGSLENLSEICSMIENYASYNIPTLIDPNFKSFLTNLKVKHNLTISLLCNTGISGATTIKKYLQHFNILEDFNFLLFSDELGFYKPSLESFTAIVSHPNCSTKNVSEILHIGDDITTDIEGANNIGMHSLLFTPETPNYGQILDYV